MKTVIFEPSSRAIPPNRDSWRFIPDSALANAGKPFFLPDFADSFEACIAPAVRIDRLGKSIGCRFAPRYFSEIIPAVHFRSAELMERLRAAGLPEDPALAFDRSLIMGHPLAFTEFETAGTLTMKRNGETVAEWSLDPAGSVIGKALERISAFNTMKTGDLVIPALSGFTGVNIGDTLTLHLSGNQLLRIDIK